MAFARTLKGSTVGRVFVAGGEPLMWRLVLGLIEILKDGGIEVVVCTSGVALNQPGMSERLVELGVKGVSVSLDSTDPDYNDTWRPPRREGDGWEGVVRGITTLLAARGSPVPGRPLHGHHQAQPVGCHRRAPAVGSRSTLEPSSGLEKITQAKHDPTVLSRAELETARQR
ncbi:radical SAM protein [Nocardiopsis dassonvillei subsp. albirubida]|uniref:Radical SAM protein n=2 Tax=Nocardiopsis alborubida TaxID=146802 RepID=A0A7X6M933_9ACTN|nr:radical SAM protein [Nocardiopsis alborubida]